jgi:hypothetical protein
MKELQKLSDGKVRQSRINYKHISCPHSASQGCPFDADWEPWSKLVERYKRPNCPVEIDAASDTWLPRRYYFLFRYAILLTPAA